jgi:CHAD domain-containing protein
MKKLRYASDFFGHLFCGRKARKRLSSFRVHLKDLQDRLGALYDITVHQRLAPGWLQKGVLRLHLDAPLLPAWYQVTSKVN